MNSFIKIIVGGCLVMSANILAPIKTLAIPKGVTLEPEQSPPIRASNYYVRAEAYNYAATYVKNGITVLLKLGQNAADTYLPDSSGTDKGIWTEVNCKTGDGLIVGRMQNYIPIPMNPQQRFNLFKIQSEPSAMAISYACIDSLKH